MAPSVSQDLLLERNKCWVPVLELFGGVGV